MSCGQSSNSPRLIIGHGDFALLFASRAEEVRISELTGTQFYLQGPNGPEGQARLSGPRADFDAMCSNPFFIEGAPKTQFLGTDRPVERLAIQSLDYSSAVYSALISRELARVQARSVDRIDGTWMISDQGNRWAIVSAFSFAREDYSSETGGDFGGFFVFDASGAEPKLIASQLSVVGQPFDVVEDWRDDVIAAFRDHTGNGIEIVVQTDYEQGTGYVRYWLKPDRVVVIDEAGCGG